MTHPAPARPEEAAPQPVSWVRWGARCLLPLGPYALAWLPAWAKKRELQRLLQLTAAAFQADPPGTAGMSYPQLLAAYAAFTQEQATLALAGGAAAPELLQLQQRLYLHAHAYGQELRRRLGVVSWAQGLRALEACYHLLGIHWRMTAEGTFVVGRCYFSTVYTPEVCRLMAALDQGLAVGILGGGELCFTARLTEGAPACAGQICREVRH